MRKIHPVMGALKKKGQNACNLLQNMLFYIDGP